MTTIDYVTQLILTIEFCRHVAPNTASVTRMLSAILSSFLWYFFVVLVIILLGVMSDHPVVIIPVRDRQVVLGGHDGHLYEYQSDDG